MKFTKLAIIILFVISTITSVNAQNNTQNKVSLKFEDESLENILNTLEKKFEISFTYPSSLISNQEKISINFINSNLEESLKKLFKQTNIDFSLRGKNIILFEKRTKKKYTISGIISEDKSLETLIGATIISVESNKGTVSNQYGFYSLELDEGKYNIKISYVGFSSLEKKINLNKDQNINFNLIPSSESLNEVVITATKANEKITDIGMSVEKVDIKTIQSMPAFMGETDVLKSLQMLPGVQSSGDATANLNVRGGSYDQNLILLDDAPIYNPSHALGFFSIFNADAIKNVEIYKGGLPAQYGDRLSSVVDIRMKDGNLNEFSGVGSIGTIATKLSIEGPILRQKSSFIISGRYSYAGFVADNFAKVGNGIGIFKSELQNYTAGNDVSFYDLNMKANFIINEKNRVFLSSYVGRDNFYFKLIDEKSSMDWGNITSTLRWNHIFNKKLFSNTTLAFSNFDYSYFIKDDIRNYEWSSDLQELDLKSDYDFYINSRNHIKFGISVNYHHINPGQIDPRSSTSITEAVSLEDNYGIENALYLSNSQKINSRLSLEYGLRLSYFIRFGAGEVYNYTNSDMNEISDTTFYKKGDIRKTYLGLEPRLNFRYKLNSQSSIKGSYCRTRQNMHLLTTSSIGLPTDVWYMAGTHLKPQIADQFSIGYFRNFNENMFESSAEAYYKNMQNQIDFIDNADLFLNPHIEQEIKIGNGWAYGIEFLLRKKTGNFKGWLSYTWSKTERQIEGINNGNPYPTRYDKTHDISLMLSYLLNKRISFSANFTYSTGAAITAPVGSFSFQGITVNNYTDRNAYRLPDYNRLDLAMTLKSKKTRTFDGEWVFSIYNAYNRHNAFSIYTKANDYDVTSSEASVIYMFGVVPSVSYKIKF